MPLRLICLICYGFCLISDHFHSNILNLCDIFPKIIIAHMASYLLPFRSMLRPLYFAAIKPFWERHFFVVFWLILTIWKGLWVIGNHDAQTWRSFPSIMSTIYISNCEELSDEHACHPISKDIFKLLRFWLYDKVENQGPVSKPQHLSLCLCLIWWVMMLKHL